MIMSSRFVLMITVVCFLSISFAEAFAQKPAAKPEPKAVKIDMQGKDYQRILGGPPESVAMHSGAVALEPGKSVGKHSTKSYEELLVVIDGEGVMMLEGGKELNLKAGMVAYCPPDTEHDVKNTGAGVLRYIYVASKVK
jgi:quercetin dioxygenase-like cupin family protein